MVRNYLKHTRSIEELDALFARDRELAAVAAAELFEHDVDIALTNFKHMHKVAQAQILADTKVAISEILSESEIQAKKIMVLAQKAKFAALVQAHDDQYFHHDTPEKLQGIREKTAAMLSKLADQGVTDIETTRKRTIERLSKLAQATTADIKALANTAKKEIAANAKRAEEKLKKQKQNRRTPEEVFENAKQAAEMILRDAAETSGKLDEASTKHVDELTRQPQDALDELERSTSDAKKHLVETLENALAILGDEAPQGRGKVSAPRRPLA